MVFIADWSVLGHSASGRNLNVDSRRSPLAKKTSIPFPLATFTSAIGLTIWRPYFTMPSSVQTLDLLACIGHFHLLGVLIKRRSNIPHIKRKFRRDRLQSHIWLTASSHIFKCLRISSYIRKSFLTYDFATDPICIFLYMKKILFLFYQCGGIQGDSGGKNAFQERTFQKAKKAS